MTAHEQLFANGECINASNLHTWRDGKTGILADLGTFLSDWFSPSDKIQLQTSGSTGKPTTWLASKKAMRASAQLSCSIFHLKRGDSALLALPLRYIAGKMMVVRALVAGLHLVVKEPCATPLSDIKEKSIDFAPLVPMQVIRTIQEGGIGELAKVHTILLGGGFIDPDLEVKLQNIPSRIFASYGMTETLSHIALRCVNGTRHSTSYTPLPGVSVSLSAEGTLVINAPHLDIYHLQTHDLGKLLPNNKFLVLGRLDAVINSGGIKIHAELLEQTILAATGVTTIALPSPHPVLGQCVALLWEGDPSQEAAIKAACSTLPRYSQPQILQNVAVLPRTASGKIARRACVALLKN